MPFYENLRRALARDAIELRLIHGHFSRYDQAKKDLATISWAKVLRNRVVRVFGKEVYWQPALRDAIDSDLVIVEQANRLVLNYILLAIKRVFRFKLAFWGHGRNYQSQNPNGLLEQLKRFYSNKVDWWFAYTSLSADAVSNTGFPDTKITVVQNSVETDLLRIAMGAVTPSALRSLREALRLEGDQVALYCGGMYSDKKLDFLLDSCVRIQSLLPDFHMIFIGSGPEQHKVERAATKHPWMHYVGPRFGAERAPYFLISRAFLMPGLVGLAIVDSFVTGVPLFTTDIPIHSPEIVYLENGINGVMTPHSVEAYAHAVADHLTSHASQSALTEGCAHSAQIYTLDNMVKHFHQGIKDCLSA